MTAETKWTPSGGQSAQELSANGGSFGVPSIYCAILGMAFAIVGREAFRYPTLPDMQSHVGIFPIDGIINIPFGTLIATLMLAVMAFLCRSGLSLNKVFSLPLMLLCCILMAIPAISQPISSISQNAASLLVYATFLNQICGFYLLGAWAYATFDRMTIRSSFPLIVIASLVAGIVQVLLGFSHAEISGVLCAIIPFLSLIAWLRYRKQTAIDARIEVETLRLRAQECTEYAEPSGATQSSIGFSSTGKPPDAACLFGNPTSKTAVWISLLACGSINYTLHMGWTHVVIVTWGPILNQTLGSVGVIAVCLILLGITQKYAMLRSCTFYVLLNVVVLVLSAVGLCLTLDVQSISWIMLSAPVLNATHTVIMIMVWMLPFCLETDAPPMTHFFFALCMYRIGALVSNILEPLILQNYLFPILCLGLMGICVVVLGICMLRTEEDRFVAGQDKSLHAADNLEVDDEQQSTYEAMLFRTFISDIYGLTKREAEVALSLGEGLTLSEISEQLVISPETAKTHRRNALRKMRVATTRELIDLVKELHENEFETFRRVLIANIEPRN